MLFAFLLLAAADLVPMRWASADPKSLELLAATPVNCLLIEKADWSGEFNKAAKAAGITTLAVLRSAQDAAPAGFDGVVAEGDFALPKSDGLSIALPSRARMRFDARPVVGTWQGVWPGIQAEEEGKTHAAPSGAPWIHTNGGFLRFVRAASGDVPVWIANRPPANQVFTAERYMQAIADAGIVGARWVIALDDDFSKRLHARDERVLREWKRIAAMAAWYASHPEWAALKPVSKLALVQDTDSGALYSGGVLDMIAVKHTPVLAVPSHQLTPERMRGVSMAVNVAPSTLTDAQKEALKAFARGGGTTLTAPATWSFPEMKPDVITLGEKDVKTLDEIWKETNAMTGRRNLGVRLFNVSSMLSSLSGDGAKTVLHLINYSGYPVENVTVHLLGKYKSARLVAPGAKDVVLQVYEIEEGTGVDVDSVGVAAALLLE